MVTCDQAVKGMKITVPPRLKRVKKGDDGEVPEEVQRECSLLKLVCRGVLGTGVDKAKKRREFDLIVLTEAIVYIDLVCGNAFVMVACRIFANCDPYFCHCTQRFMCHPRSLEFRSPKERY